MENRGKEGERKRAGVIDLRVFWGVNRWSKHSTRETRGLPPNLLNVSLTLQSRINKVL